MNYFASLFITMIIVCGPIRPMDRNNDNHTLHNNKFKIIKYGVNCPLDVDLKELIKKQYKEIFGKQKMNGRGGTYNSERER